jgi:hypothetical protein
VQSRCSVDLCENQRGVNGGIKLGVLRVPLGEVTKCATDILRTVYDRTIK